MSESFDVREAARHLKSVRDVLRFAVSQFQRAHLNFGHGSDNAFDEAAYLILHTLRLPLERLEPFLDAVLLPEEVARVLGVISRRVDERVPAAYLTNEAWLGDYRFYVDERVIVPRSHIAGLIQQGLTEWGREPEDVGSALDLCTGSGCLAILLALAYEHAKLDAVDISKDALAVARLNVESYGLSERVELVESDLFAGLGKRRYDLIVSNPPYVTDAAMRALPEEYRREPSLALAAGEDGMDVVRGILRHARAHLNEGGVLVVEIGAGRELAEAAFPGLAFTWLETDAGGDQVFLLEREQLPAA